MVCAECMKMCCLGGKNSVVKGLMRFSNELQSVVDDRGIFISVFYASAKGWSSIPAVNKCSSNLFIETY